MDPKDLYVETIAPRHCWTKMSCTVCLSNLVNWGKVSRLCRKRVARHALMCMYAVIAIKHEALAKLSCQPRTLYQEWNAKVTCYSHHTMCWNMIPSRDILVSHLYFALSCMFCHKACSLSPFSLSFRFASVSSFVMYELCVFFTVYLLFCSLVLFPLSAKIEKEHTEAHRIHMMMLQF